MNSVMRCEVCDFTFISAQNGMIFMAIKWSISL